MKRKRGPSLRSLSGRPGELELELDCVQSIAQSQPVTEGACFLSTLCSHWNEPEWTRSDDELWDMDLRWWLFSQLETTVTQFTPEQNGLDTKMYCWKILENGVPRSRWRQVWGYFWASAWLAEWQLIFTWSESFWLPSVPWSVNKASHKERE